MDWGSGDFFFCSFSDYANHNSYSVSSTQGARTGIVEGHSLLSAGADGDSSLYSGMAEKQVERLPKQLNAISILFALVFFSPPPSCLMSGRLSHRHLGGCSPWHNA